MARKQNNSPQAKRNRNNRKRGAKFEKKVADYLDMYVVPYSGSNSRFGFGDIRDSEGKNGGIWLGEAKNRVCDDKFTIEKKWWTDLNKEAGIYQSYGFIAFTKSGRTEKYIMLRSGIFYNLNKHGMFHLQPKDLFVTIAPKRVHNTKNYIVDMNTLQKLKPNKNAMQIGFEDELPQDRYFIMRLETFRSYLRGFPSMHSRYCVGGDLYEDTHN